MERTLIVAGGLVLLALLAITFALVIQLRRRATRLEFSLEETQRQVTRLQKPARQVTPVTTDGDVPDTARSIETTPPVDRHAGTGSADWPPDTDAVGTAEVDDLPVAEVSQSQKGAEVSLARLYAQWCQDHRKPQIPEGIEVSPLRYAGTERVSELAPPTYLFQDHPQTGEFLRFSKSGEDRGAVLPDPESHFEYGVHRILFPELDSQQFKDSQYLSRLKPVRMQMRSDGKWQKA